MHILIYNRDSSNLNARLKFFFNRSKYKNKKLIDQIHLYDNWKIIIVNI